MFESLNPESPWTVQDNQRVYEAVMNSRAKYTVVLDDDPGGVTYWAARAIRKKKAGYLYIAVPSDRYAALCCQYNAPEFAPYRKSVKIVVVESGGLKGRIPTCDLVIGKRDAIEILTDQHLLCRGCRALAWDGLEGLVRWRAHEDTLYRYTGLEHDINHEASIDLLVPSRERPGWRRRLAESVASTKLTDRVTLTFGIDADDPTLHDTKVDMVRFPFVKIVVLPYGKDTFPGLGRLWNDLARQSTSDILAMIGDDMVFSTAAWDSEISWEFSPEELPADRLKLVYCDDGGGHCEMAVNFFIHRAYVEATGYLMREEFKYDMIDVWIQEVMTALGRVTIRPDIVIRHLHWSRDPESRDATTDRLRGHNPYQVNHNLWEDTRDTRVAEIEALAKITGTVPDYSNLMYFEKQDLT